MKEIFFFFWFVCWLVGWLAGCLASWLFCWLAGLLLVDWMVLSYVCCLVVSFVFSLDIEIITTPFSSCCTSVDESMSVTITF